MRRAARVTSMLIGAALADARGAAGQSPPTGSVPRAVAVARTTVIPACTAFVDAAAAPAGIGSPQRPYATMAAAVAAAEPGAVICVAEGVYAETLTPGEKHLALAGGFQRGRDFKVRDSALYVSHAKGRGGSFIRMEDPGPKDGQLTAIDGFEISGYSQAIYRDIYYSQRFEITNNHIHDNRCADDKLAGAGFALNNVSGRIAGNVIRNNACGRGGAGFLNDDSNTNAVVIEGNLIEGNAGVEPDTSHGGGLYLFTNRLTITGNAFVGNSVTQWGGGLYIGAYTQGGQYTDATLSWNSYRGNRAGNSGGGFFCDEAAGCASSHEIYAGNCGGNILLDGGQDESGPSRATFDHVTVAGALEVGCGAPGTGVLITKDTTPPATYTFTNALFWGNAPGRDLATFCDRGCDRIKVTVANAMVQREHAKQNMAAEFGPGIVTPSDPLFADPASGDFHLRSAAGRWTSSGYVPDSETSPALGRTTSPVRNPVPTGGRPELGAYGGSPEASRTP